MHTATYYYSDYMHTPYAYSILSCVDYRPEWKHRLESSFKSMFSWLSSCSNSWTLKKTVSISQWKNITSNGV